jgi:hypothetical protein
MRGGGLADSSLAGPIFVRRRKRWGRRFFWTLFLLVLVAAGLVLLRVAVMPFPVVAQVARPPGDGLRLLKGMTHLVVESGDLDAARKRIAEAFAARLDFVVLAEPGGVALREDVQHAPLAVVHAQQVDSPRGWFLAVGADRPITAGESAAGATFERVRQAAGWSMVVRPLDHQRPWRAWDELVPDAFEFLNASSQSFDLDWQARLVHWAGMLLGTDAVDDHLGVRPKAGLARWDDYTRKGPVQGACGLDDGASGYRVPLTYVYVQDGLGPYGPGEVDRALRQGHSFCALPIFADPSGFRFLATPAGGGVVLGNMGDQVALGQGVDLIANLHYASEPEHLELVLYQDGVEVRRSQGSRLVHRTNTPGTFRVEASVQTRGLWLQQTERVFLYSNPIFVVESPKSP